MGYYDKDDSTWPEDLDSFLKGDQDEFLDDLAYFDEYPEDDPFMPKPTCPSCEGLGVVTDKDGREWTCTSCGGTGAVDGR